MFRKEYKISLNNEDRVTPEETLVDSGSQYSDLEKPINNNVFRFSMFLIILLSSIVFLFAFQLAVPGHAEYARLAFDNKTVNFFIPPPRGLILDRLGKSLAANISSFDLLVISKEVRDNFDASEKEKVADILGIPRDEFLEFISENIRSNAIFFAAKDLSKDKVLALEFFSPQGFYVVPNTKRTYIDGHQFSSVLGYIGRVNRDDIAKGYYRPIDTIGRLGIEAQYEELLRGEHGKILFSREETENLHIDPAPGKNLVLNIDFELQKKLYNELYSVLVNENLSEAAAIIQDPRNGQVLALVSFPSYDNNLFSAELSDRDFRNFFESKSRPLFNRVISGLYNPGSTIKPFMGLMILQEEIFKTTDTIRDCVSLVIPHPFNKDAAPSVFRNWREDTGLFNMRRAIADSCNIYFFIGGGGFGNTVGLGISKIAEYLKASMADNRLGIDLPGEARGFVPTPDWKMETRKEPWYQGDTYNVSIGQGDLEVTPLWLNTYVSAIANGGTVYKPMVAQRIVDDKNNVIRIFEKESLIRLPFEPNIVTEIKSNMEETVISGTAKLLQGLPVRAGAKTGTAEVVKGSRINAIFSAFAPFENPEITITVLVEGASVNQGMAVVASYNVLKWYFSERQNSVIYQQ